MSDEDEWVKAFCELSLADRELCRRDILLYGNAWINRAPDGKAYRVPPVLPEPEPLSSWMTGRPWWDA